MKENDLQRLADWGYDIHGCHRGVDGCCYYLASKEPQAFGGDYRGRVFHAYAESDDSELPSQKLELQMFISRTALATARIQTLVGEYESFIAKKGAEHLREFLDKGLAPIEIAGGRTRNPNKHRIDLTNNSPDEEFKCNATSDVVSQQVLLGDEILRQLLTLHLDIAQKRINRKDLLKQLCAEPHRIDRALRSLENEGFLEGVTRGEIKLTPSGDRAAQKSRPAQTHDNSAFAQFQIAQERGSGNRIFEEMLEAIEQAPDLVGNDDDAPGIGHNQPPEFLEEFQAVVAKGSAAINESQLSRTRIADIRDELARFKGIFLEKFSETMGDQAAKWFWRVLAVLAAHAIGILDRIVSLLNSML